MPVQKTKDEALLSPYRVLDLTDEKGYLCGKILGDLGADVIKIEPPGGDKGRKTAPFFQDKVDPEKSLPWLVYNTSKRGITLDVETREGQEIFEKLIAGADFIIESFPPGFMGKVGLGYDHLREINPRIILTSISPFGQTGPYSGFKASDIVAMAMGGLMYLCGDADRPPLRFTIEQSLPQAGAQAASGTLIAHHYREMTGEGQWVDVSIQECVMQATWVTQQFWGLSKLIQQRKGNRHPRGQITKQTIFPCRDGYIAWQVMTAQEGSKTRALVEWMEREEMAGDLGEVEWGKIDMDKIIQSELEHWEEQFARFFLTHTKAELHEEAVKKDMLLMPVNTTADVLQNRQLYARDFWTGLEHPELAACFKYPGPAFKLEKAQWKINRPAPHIGEHNEEIYVNEMGLSTSGFEKLKEAGVV